MLSIGRILYPTDFSRCAEHALPHTLHLVERYGSEFHLLHALVLHEMDPGNAAHRLPDMEQLYLALEAQAASRLQAAAKSDDPTSSGIHVAQMRAISAAAAILDYATEHDIDLIVMGTHGRRGLRRFLLGSIAEEVLRLAPCPVLIVPEKGDGLFAKGVAKRIVVPVDFSEHARLALSYATELAQTYQASLELLHVVDEVVYPDFYPPVTPSGGTLSEELRGQSLKRMRALVPAGEPPSPEVNVHVRAGRAAPQIAEFAEELPADLVVIASHGLTGLSHILLGSVTEQLVRRAPCPVLTVKAFGKNLISEA